LTRRPPPPPFRFLSNFLRLAAPLLDPSLFLVLLVSFFFQSTQKIIEFLRFFFCGLLMPIRKAERARRVEISSCLVPCSLLFVHLGSLTLPFMLFIQKRSGRFGTPARCLRNYSPPSFVLLPFFPPIFDFRLDPHML